MISKFKQSIIDLGEVMERHNIDVIFETEEDISKQIDNYSGYCGSCISVDKYEENKLYIKLYTGTIPLHLEVNRYEIYKSLYVNYTDNTFEELTIKATVIK